MRLGRTIDRLNKKAPQPPVTWQVSRVQPKTGRILYTLTVEPDGPTEARVRSPSSGSIGTRASAPGPGSGKQGAGEALLELVRDMNVTQISRKLRKSVRSEYWPTPSDGSPLPAGFPEGLIDPAFTPGIRTENSGEGRFQRPSRTEALAASPCFAARHGAVAEAVEREAR